MSEFIVHNVRMIQLIPKIKRRRHMLTVQPSRWRLESVNEERRVTQFAVGCGYFFIFHFFSLCIG